MGTHTDTWNKLADFFACAPERGREIGIFAAEAKLCRVETGRAEQGKMGLGWAGEDSKGTSWIHEGWLSEGGGGMSYQPEIWAHHWTREQGLGTERERKTQTNEWEVS